MWWIMPSSWWSPSLTTLGLRQFRGKRPGLDGFGVWSGPDRSGRHAVVGVVGTSGGETAGTDGGETAGTNGGRTAGIDG